MSSENTQSNATISQISAVIITKNAETKIAQCLLSLSDFSEVVIYDNGSTDATIDIAKQFPNVQLHSGEFLGFGPSKNHAISLASNDWVFAIDADEHLSVDLRRSLSKLNLGDPLCVYQISRENYFMGKAVHHGSWGNDILSRLFHRGTHQYSNALVHEHVALSKNSKTHLLEGKLLHDAVDDIGQFLEKINRYSELRKNNAQAKSYPVPIILIKSIWAFIRSYILKAGFLDGWRGLVIAVSNANGVFYKNMKIFANKQQ